MHEDAKTTTINEAIYLRGLFIQRYSGIEFSLSELIMRARQHISYNHLGDLPWRFSNKIERLRKLIKVDGPIATYKDELEEAFGNFTEFSEQRNFLVHGIMTIPRDAADRTFLDFSLYDRKPVLGGSEKTTRVVHMGRMETTLKHLHALADSLQPISTNFTGLVARICREVPLPPLNLTIDNPSIAKTTGPRRTE